MNTLGLNEALILAALTGRSDPIALADIVDEIASAENGRTISIATAYVALQRMSSRGLVTVSKRSVISADDRSRSIGFYAITHEGAQAGRDYALAAKSVVERLLGAISQSLPALRL